MADNPTPVKTEITDDGLVMKNVDRIESIQTPMEVRREVAAYSWQISRRLRRDFNLIAFKMFVRSCSNRTLRAQIHELLLEIALQVTSLAAECKEYEAFDETDVRKVNLRMVSAESAILYKAMKEADALHARLNYAHKSGLITLAKRADLTYGFDAAMADLERFVYGAKSKKNKTAQEIGQEIGIG